ncbi:MAG: GNAT family N-acetyltransferase [Microbacteriaceae bacterium]
MSEHALIIRPTTDADWREVRALRLEMLQDTPEAFAETFAAASGHQESEWRMRAARGMSATGTSLVAIYRGEWAGTMGVFLPEDEEPMLVGVYVTPRFRGPEFGVADALLTGIEEWASGRGSILTLHVHEENARAQAYYRKRGFRVTGRTFPYVLDARERELEMQKPL